MFTKTLRLYETDPIDTRPIIQKIDEYINNKTLEEVLYEISQIIQPKSFDELLKESQNSQSISQFFPTKLLDKNGRVKCIIPSIATATKKDLISIMEHQACEIYTKIADIVAQSFISKARSKFNFSKNTLKFLVENNIFIESDRQDTFLNGIVAGLNFELSTAMHLLMPQVENGIRHLAEECGAVVYKTDTNGVEESLSLESILELPEVEEFFDETFLFNLRLFYTSDYGFGMRNIISHGLYSDIELQTAQSLAVFCFTLHICCMYSTNLRKKLLSQKNRKSK